MHSIQCPSFYFEVQGKNKQETKIDSLITTQFKDYTNTCNKSYQKIKGKPNLLACLLFLNVINYLVVLENLAATFTRKLSIVTLIIVLYK